LIIRYKGLLSWATLYLMMGRPAVAVVHQ